MRVVLVLFFQCTKQSGGGHW